MSKCLLSGADCETFINFGKMPIANGFLRPEQFADEFFAELKVGFCPTSSSVQLAELVNREKMFHENYAFFSSTSVRMAQHFKEFSAYVQKQYLRSPDPFVVEIGSNDGILLEHFAHQRIRHLGIEPSANVAQVAIQKGVQTLCRFFDEQLAREIIATHGPADAFLGANVMCHIPYLHSVLTGVKLLLKPTGVMIFEDPYLGDIVEKTSFDQMYDEHAFYFCVSSVSYAVEKHGMEVIDVQPQSVHGGSMRYVIAHAGAYAISEAVHSQRRKENALGLHKAETYEHLRQKIEGTRDELMALLHDIKNAGKRVVGYGATSKSTTVINYCGITRELVECIYDTTPIKQGKYSPGAHISIRSYDEFPSRYPDYALLFAWNHGEEIMAKEEKFRSAGGKFIVYVPSVQVIS